MNLVLSSCEQVWPPIPTDWDRVSSSYAAKFARYDLEDQGNKEKEFLVVVYAHLHVKVKSMLKEKMISFRTISNANRCVDFLIKETNSRIVLLIPLIVEDEILPLVQNLNQAQTIYILCDTDLHPTDEVPNSEIQYISLKNVEVLGKILLKRKKQFDPVSFTSVGVDELNSSLMYSILLKEILLELEYDDQTAKEDFLDYCRYEHGDDPATLRTINRFGNDYCEDRAIYWYTQPCLFFELLNRALRTEDIDILVRISFMLRHLHKQIERIYLNQISTIFSTPFHVYRGQGMQRQEFQSKIQNRLGGLLSFNSFLSTSRDSDVAQLFILQNDPDKVAVLFDIIVDRSRSTHPCAALLKDSAISDEEEILFSMHSVFSIQKVEKDAEKNIWNVTLTLTSKDDPQLHQLTSYLRKTIDASLGWDRLENLMIEIGKWNMVKPLLEASLASDSAKGKTEKQAYRHHQLGVVNAMIGNYSTAIEHYHKSLALRSSKDFIDLALTHNGIGSTLEEQGHRPEALKHYQYALDFIYKLDHPNVEALLSVKNNIAGILQHQGKLLQALDIYEECLRLETDHLPALHPHLAISYANIATVYNDLNEWENELKFALKALDIEQRSLPSDHPTLATTHSNIALTLRNLDRNEEAILHLQKTIEILSKSFPSDHPSLRKHQLLLQQFNRNIEL